MLDIDRRREIIVVLKKNRLRTALTAFGVFWGIFLLIVLLGSGRGLQKGAVNEFGGLATNSVFIWTRHTTIPYKGFPRGRRFHFNNSDVEALKENISEIKVVAPRIHGWGGGGAGNAVRGEKTGSFSVEGFSPAFWDIKPVRMLRGRYLNELDVEQKRKVALIGSRVYELLFEPGENPIGGYIRLKGVYFKVIGVYDPLTTRERDFDERERIILPYTTLQNVYGYGDTLGFIVLTSKDDIPASAAEMKAKTLLARRHYVSPEDKHAFGSNNLEEEFNKLRKLFLSIEILIWVVGTGTLLSGVIGVSNIMLITVKERTREFGIKRAIGATPFNIIKQVVLESIFLTTLTGLPGIAAGVWVLEGVSAAMTGMNTGMFAGPEVGISAALKALLILIISGTLAGLIPARGAVSVKPIDAIRK